MKKRTSVSLYLFAIVVMALTAGCSDDKDWAVENKKAVDALFVAYGENAKFESVNFEVKDKSVTFAKLQGALEIVGDNGVSLATIQYTMDEMQLAGVDFATEKPASAVALADKVTFKGIQYTTTVTPAEGVSIASTTKITDAITQQIKGNGATLHKIFASGKVTPADMKAFIDFSYGSAEAKGYTAETPVPDMGSNMTCTVDSMTAGASSMESASDLVMNKIAVSAAGMMNLTAEKMEAKKISFKFAEQYQQILDGTFDANAENVFDEMEFAIEGFRMNGMSVASPFFGAVILEQVSLDVKKDKENFVVKHTLDNLKLPVKMVQNIAGMSGIPLDIASIYDKPEFVFSGELDFSVALRGNMNEAKLNTVRIRENNLGGMGLSLHMEVPTEDGKFGVDGKGKMLAGNVQFENKGIADVMFKYIAKMTNPSASPADMETTVATVRDEFVQNTLTACKQNKTADENSCAAMGLFLQKNGKLDISFNPPAPVAMSEDFGTLLQQTPEKLGMTITFTAE